MIQNLSTDTPLEEMRKTLFRDGVFKIDNYLKGSDLRSLHDEVYSRCYHDAGHYEFGRNYRGDDLSTYPEGSAISKTYNEKWMRDLHSLYTGSPDRYGINVFATYDYKFDGELARNGWLHFDRLWRLKFFIYLI